MSSRPTRRALMSVRAGRGWRRLVGTGMSLLVVGGAAAVTILRSGQASAAAPALQLAAASGPTPVPAPTCSNIAGTHTVVYRSTDGEQTCVIPFGVSSVDVVAVGQAGNLTGSGRGARVGGTFSVTAGQTLYLSVGLYGGATGSSYVAGYGGGLSEVRTCPAATRTAPGTGGPGGGYPSHRPVMPARATTPPARPVAPVPVRTATTAVMVGVAARATSGEVAVAPRPTKTTRRPTPEVAVEAAAPATPQRRSLTRPSHWPTRAPLRRSASAALVQVK